MGEKLRKRKFIELMVVMMMGNLLGSEICAELPGANRGVTQVRGRRDP